MNTLYLDDNSEILRGSVKGEIVDFDYLDTKRSSKQQFQDYYQTTARCRAG